METASSHSKIADIVVIGHFLIIVVRGTNPSWAFVRSLSIYSSVWFVGNPPTADKETQCDLYGILLLQTRKLSAVCRESSYWR